MEMLLWIEATGEPAVLLDEIDVEDDEGCSVVRGCVRRLGRDGLWPGLRGLTVVSYVNGFELTCILASRSSALKLPLDCKVSSKLWHVLELMYGDSSLKICSLCRLEHLSQLAQARVLLRLWRWEGDVAGRARNSS